MEVPLESLELMFLNWISRGRIRKRRGWDGSGESFASPGGLSLGRDWITECEKQRIRVDSGNVGCTKIPSELRNTNIFTSTEFQPQLYTKGKSYAWLIQHWISDTGLHWPLRGRADGRSKALFPVLSGGVPRRVWVWWVNPLHFSSSD